MDLGLSPILCYIIKSCREITCTACAGYFSTVPKQPADMGIYVEKPYSNCKWYSAPSFDKMTSEGRRNP